MKTKLHYFKHRVAFSFKRTIATGLFFLTAFAVLFINNSASAQTWYFGAYGSIAFNGSTPSGNTQYNGREANSIISDANGNVIMYTDGVNLWNGNHILQNLGNSLKSDVSSTQGVLIVPSACGSCNEYFIFTTDAVENDFSNGWYVVKATVTGTAPNTSITLGTHTQLGVTSSGSVIPMTEKLTATPDGSGGYYVFVHGVGLYNGNSCVNTVSCQNESNFFSVHITPNTCDVNDLANTFTAQTIGLSHRDANHPYPSGGYQFNGQGQMKFNRAGTILGVVLPFERKIQLFQVNNGVLSNEITLDASTGALPASGPIVYGLEFSPYNNLLYVSLIYHNDESIVQFDLNSWLPATIATTKLTLHSMSNGLIYDYGALQLAPDGKIYVTRPQHTFMDVIQAPDVQGTGCQYTPSAVTFSGTCELGLPNVVVRNGCEYWTGVSDNSEVLSHITVFPSPVTDKLQVQWDPQSTVGSIELLTLDGKLLLRIRISHLHNEEFIDVSELTSGMYLIRVFSDNTVSTESFVKE